MCAFLDRGLSVSEVVSGLQIEENGADLTQRLGGNQIKNEQFIFIWAPELCGCCTSLDQRRNKCPVIVLLVKQYMKWHAE